MPEIESGASLPPFGVGPYADWAEVTGPPEVIVETYKPGKFLPTDARSILCVLRPQHYNFIKNPSFRTDSTGWYVTESLLDSAIWSVDASRVSGGNKLTDLSGGGRDLTFGAAAAAPRVLDWAGEDYLSVHTGTAGSNHISGVIPNFPAVCTMSWDIETTALSGSDFNLVVHSTLDGAIRVFITTAGAFSVQTWVGGVVRTATWAGAVVANSRNNYQVGLTTTGATLYINGVLQGAGEVAFGATRVPAANTSSVLLQTQGATTPTFFRIYSFDLYGGLIFNPANHNAAYTTISNPGTAGGTWTISRPTTGYKTAVVDRPLLLFGGAQDASHTLAADLPAKEFTILHAWRIFESGTGVLRLFTTNSNTVTAGVYHYLQTVFANRVYSASDTLVGVSDIPAQTSPTPLAGQVIYGARTDANKIYGIKNGAVVSNAALTGTPMLGKSGKIVKLGYTSSGISGEFLAAAMWDRALSDAEIAEATTDMAAGITAVQRSDLLDSDSWVGQSVKLHGGGVIRPKDGGHYVYTGITGQGLELTAHDSVRESPEWAFSAYVKGTAGRVRLVMDAYYPVDGTVVGSPPEGLSLTTVADPSTANYGDARVKDSAGIIWDRKDPPFYTSVGQVNVTTTPPSTITTQGLLAPAVRAGDDAVWEVITTPTYPTAPSYYQNWGIPNQVADPRAAAGGGPKYLRDSTVQRNIWRIITPPPSDYPYYASISLPYAEDPTALLPNKELFPRHLLYGTNLWRVKSPMPSSLPYYEDLGAATTVTTDPDTDVPGAAIVKKVMAPVDAPGVYTVWLLNPKPYYVSTGRGAAFSSVYGPWTEMATTDWTRLVISTRAYLPVEGGRVHFSGCAWIDARLEYEGATDLRASSFQLDPKERPVAEYFDGSMQEQAEINDYLWSDETKPNNSISWYYYDRVARVSWLWENLRQLIPVSRPLQIFFEDYDHPYIPSKGLIVPTGAGAYSVGPTSL